MFRGCFLREAALFGSVSEFHLFEADTGADFDRLLYTPLGGCGKMDGGENGGTGSKHNFRRRLVQK